MQSLQTNIPPKRWIDVETLIVNKKRCCGCGVCASSCPIDGCISIKFDKNREYLAQVDHEKCINCGKCLKVCPDDYTYFDKIVKKLSQKNNDFISNELIGPYYKNYVGYVTQTKGRLQSASGGLLSELLIYLMKNSEIDGAAVAIPTDPSSGKLFECKIVRSVEEIKSSRGTKYYPIEYSKVLNEIKGSEGRFAVVGTPCVINAIRKLEYINKDFRGKILYYLALVCGHNVSAAYTEFLIKKNEILYETVKKVKYRDKKGITNASNFSLMIDSSQGVTRFPFFNTDFGLSWYNLMFSLNKCLYCPDFAGIFSDASFADAWLPEYIKDVRGTSIVIVRDQRVDNILKKMIDSKYIYLQSISLEKVINSQKQQIKFKQEDIKCRIAFKKLFNRNFPDYNINWAYRDYFKSFGEVNSLMLRVHLSKLLYRWGILKIISTKGYVYSLRPFLFIKVLLSKVKKYLMNLKYSYL